jgi:hypothetical protein
VCAGAWVRRCVIIFSSYAFSLIPLSFLAHPRARTSTRTRGRPHTRGRSRTRGRTQAASPASDVSIVPFALPPEDTVPKSPPSVPLRGTESAPLDAIITWRAELDTATLECSNAAAGIDAATSAKGAAKQRLHAAVAENNAAITEESNAIVRSSIASNRHKAAWSRYLNLLGLSHVDDVKPLKSVNFKSHTTRENDTIRASVSDDQAKAGDDHDNKDCPKISVGMEDVGKDEAEELLRVLEANGMELD